jgi:predicted dehydrogenase
LQADDAEGILTEKVSSGGLRAAVVGAGLMGRWHAHALSRAGALLVGVCDTDLRAAQRLSGGEHRVTADLEELLDATAPEVVHICTPLPTHAPLIGRVLERGCHVIVEKPLAETEKDTERLLALAAERGRRLFPAHPLLYQRWIGDVSRLGALRSLDYVLCSAGADASAPAGPAGKDETVMNVLPHPLSLYELFCPEGLDAAGWQVTRSGPGELRAHGVSNGITLSLSISMSARPTRHELVVTGERGTLHADLFHGFATREAPLAGRAYKILRPFSLSARRFAGASLNLARRALTRESAYPGLRELIRSCYREIRIVGGVEVEERGRPRLSPRHAANVARARDAIRRLAAGTGAGP